MDKICKLCGYCGPVVKKGPGTLGTEITFWIIGFIVPPFLTIAAIFSLYRFALRRAVCPKCGSPDVIPLDSPMGKKVYKEFHLDFWGKN